ncbi:hypothetical protein Dsin_025466 [Dipteronia sinensis]|uniref:Pectin lyase-like superfamily protein n=1 Tax=Dipteronia sinensis TaxID=43782 RepID=A0AAD9ZW24_9ROSI|nr:hypothetical protein Dsin_025466 [Dipteronia sinensis]
MDSRCCLFVAVDGFLVEETLSLVNEVKNFKRGKVKRFTYTSVGTLGKYSDETDVNRVLVTDCKLTGTTNGARIKTWLASPSLKASSITYQNIVMDMVKNPIIIDQEYGAQKPELSNVALTDIHFKNITGSSMTDTVVNFVCTKNFPCCVELADIDLVYKGGEKNPPKQECVNAKVTFAGKQNPAACRC